MAIERFSHRQSDEFVAAQIAADKAGRELDAFRMLPASEQESDWPRYEVLRRAYSSALRTMRSLYTPLWVDGICRTELIDLEWSKRTYDPLVVARG